MRRNFSEEQAAEQEAIVEGVLADPESCAHAIAVGLSVGGLTAGGIEFLSAGQMQKRMEEVASVLEKSVKPFATVKRNLAKALASMAAGVAGSTVAMGAGMAGFVKPGFEAMVVGGEQAVEAAAKIAAPSIANNMVAAGMGAQAGMSPWWGRIGDARVKALNVLKKTKHFSRGNYRFNFAEDGSVAAPANPSEKVVGELMAADELSNGKTTKTALLAGLASVGVGTAAAGTLNLVEVKRRLKAVANELEQSANRGFWSKFISGLTGIVMFPAGEAGTQIANRKLAQVARGTAPIEDLAKRGYKLARFFS